MGYQTGRQMQLVRRSSAMEQVLPWGRMDRRMQGSGLATAQRTALRGTAQIRPAMLTSSSMASSPTGRRQAALTPAASSLFIMFNHFILFLLPILMCFTTSLLADFVHESLLASCPWVLEPTTCYKKFDIVWSVASKQSFMHASWRVM